MTPKLLFVDDDPNLLAAFQRNLRRRFTLDTALGGPEALQMIDEHGPYAVIVADMAMPGMDGVALLEQVARRSPDTVRLMLTGNADQQTAVDAVNRGSVFRFLNKPCPPDVLIPALEGALGQYELQRVEKELLEGTVTGSVKVLSEVLGLVAPEALSRGQRLRDSMRIFAQHAGVGPLWEVEVGALLSPIGFAAVPLHIIRQVSNGATLSANELTIVRRVPQVGHDLVAGIPRLAGVARIILYQNKNYDGTGFPGDDVIGTDIPAGARLLKILSDRLALEQEGIVKQRALAAMSARVGHYDPRLLALCFETFTDFLAQSLSAELGVDALGLAELASGQVVVSDITADDGTVLVASGTRLTPMILARLKNHSSLQTLNEPFLVQRADPVQAAAPAVPVS